ncbi:hypothetical protein D3C78_1199900 [compost metagenome]
MLPALFSRHVWRLVDQDAGGAPAATKELGAIFLGSQPKANGLGVIADRAGAPQLVGAKAFDVYGVIDGQGKPAVLLVIVCRVVPPRLTALRLADMFGIKQRQLGQLARAAIPEQARHGVAVGKHHLLRLLPPVIAALEHIGRRCQQVVGRMVGAWHHITPLLAQHMERHLGHAAGQPVNTGVHRRQPHRAGRRHRHPALCCTTKTEQLGHCGV